VFFPLAGHVQYRQEGHRVAEVQGLADEAAGEVGIEERCPLNELLLSRCCGLGYIKSWMITRIKNREAARLMQKHPPNKIILMQKRDNNTNAAINKVVPTLSLSLTCQH
jgi:hypothetical protein